MSVCFFFSAFLTWTSERMNVRTIFCLLPKLRATHNVNYWTAKHQGKWWDMSQSSSETIRCWHIICPAHDIGIYRHSHISYTKDTCPACHAHWSGLWHYGCNLWKAISSEYCNKGTHCICVWCDSAEFEI